MGFQLDMSPIGDLLAKIRDGVVQLPDFQRAYKWDDARIRALLVTLLRGHPLGVVMVLETGGEHVRFKPTPLAGVPAGAAATEPGLLLLDGQQRLTSLFQALSGDGVVDTEDARGKRLRRRYYVDVEAAAAGYEQHDEAVRSLPEDGILREDFGRATTLDVSSPPQQHEAGLMPVNLLLDPGASAAWLAHFVHAAGPERVAVRAKVMRRFIDGVVVRAGQYQIPVIRLDRTTTRHAVATVFEKINTGGLPLDVFELLTAMFAGDPGYYEAHGTDFRLADDWEETRQVLAAHPVLAELRRAELLQTVTLLATLHARAEWEGRKHLKGRAPATAARRENILDLDLDQYLRWAPQVRGALPWVAAFLRRECVLAAEFLPYRSQLVSLLAIRVLLGDELEVPEVLARVRQWYWCGVLGELYGGSTEGRLARDVEQVPGWALAGASGRQSQVPETVEQATFYESRLLSLRTRNAAAYKGIYALLLQLRPVDWLRGEGLDDCYDDLQVDVHHVFPRAWCKRNGIDSELRESIVNKTPLSRSSYQLLGGRAPSTYLPRFEHAAELDPAELDRLVATHAVDPLTLRASDFELFFYRRLEAVLGLVEGATGKAAVRDLGADDGGEEGADAFGPEEDEPDWDDLDDPEAGEGSEREGVIDIRRSAVPA